MEMLFFIIFIVILVVIIANWFASVYTQNNYFYNPLKQNATYTKYLDKAVALNIPIYSIIVFSDRCSL